MPDHAIESPNETLAVLHTAREDVSRLEQMYHQLSQSLLERLREAAVNLDAVTGERDQMREEIAQLKATLAESQRDIELYRRSLLAVTHRPFTITKEELDEARKSPPLTIEGLLEEIQRPEEG